MFFVGRYLRVKGDVFLADSFEKNPSVAEAVSSLLNIGFYIICIGILLMNMGSNEYAADLYAFLRNLSVRLGLSIFAVGAIHFFNILVVAILSRKR